MSKSKHKVKKLTDEQYNAYIAFLKDNAAIYSPDGGVVTPPPFKDD
jgi:hypothetical protein